jgi:uncharacterized protein YycO
MLVAYVVVRLQNGDDIPSLMVRRGTDKALEEALTLEIADDIYGVIRHGDWILSRHYALHSDFFDLMQPRSAASHASLYDATSDHVIEAVYEGVQEKVLERLIRDAHSVIIVRPTEQSRGHLNSSVKRARMELGADFDYLGVLGLRNSPGKFYCAELIFDTYGLDKGGKRIVRPTDLLDHGRVVYAGIRTNHALRARAARRLGRKLEEL